MNRRQLLCLPLLAGCASLRDEPLAAIDRAIEQVIARRGMPGAVFRLERDAAASERGYGHMTYDADATPVTPSTVWDIASLTKVVATAPSVLLLAEEGRLDLEAPVARWLPECSGAGRDGVTIRHLLTHTSGMPAGLPAKPAWHGAARGLDLACSRVPDPPPGSAFRYSDVNYVLLGSLVERVAGEPLDQFAQRRIFGPLGMHDTGYLPLAQPGMLERVAPTQQGSSGAHTDVAPGQRLRGIVHDPTARRMGGVAGSAGVFSTAADLSRFARMLLGDGALEGVRVLSPRSVRRLTTVQSPPGLPQRAMGMDIDSPFARPRGAVFPVGSYGHTGFTGCILWIDPGTRTFYVFLSNRVYPDDMANILPLYGTLGTLAARTAL
jgi:CubicO group peptidase (beta-lactamase class C family)